MKFHTNRKRFLSKILAHLFTTASYVRVRTNFSVSLRRCMGRHDSDAKEKLVANGTVVIA